MEGRTGAAAPQGGRYYGGRRGGGGDSSGDESDGSSAGVELSLRLRTGSSPPAAAAAAAAVAEREQEAAAARRRMTIFYDGRVCAVDVTEIQAREIITMANQEILLAHQRQQHREDRHVQDRGSTSGGGQVLRPTAVPLSPAAGCPRQGLAAMQLPVTDQSGLSMKRSLQLFLQKREARRAEAGGGGRQQAQALRH